MNICAASGEIYIHNHYALKQTHFPFHFLQSTDWNTQVSISSLYFITKWVIYI
jgi:hypothetical protein